MSLTTPNMSLVAWNNVGDNFSHTDLLNNWDAVDAHDHTAGKGLQIPTAGVANQAITQTKIANNTITAAQIASATITGTQIANATITGGKVAAATITKSLLASDVPLPPAGSLMLFGGTSAPSGWLFCDGSAVSRTTFSGLFAAISITYGTGDGSTTFNLPDARGRVLVGAGQGAGLTNRLLAGTGGEETHILSTAETPAHSHSYLSSRLAFTSGGVNGDAFFAVGGTQGNGGTYNVSTVGSGGSHNNMQPYLAVNYMIKT